MPDSEMDKELEAIKSIAKALGSLEPVAQQRALEYVVEHFGLQVEFGGGSGSDSSAAAKQVSHAEARPGGEGAQQSQVTDIRSFKEQKQPQSGIQMAVVAAYYLSEFAPAEVRKADISPSDLTDLFKQAGYPLPKRPEFTLPNAKQAGYLDSVGHGKYKLNPVGHNLVAHNLPKAGGDVKVSSRPRKKASSTKKIRKKKTAKKTRKRKAR